MSGLWHLIARDVRLAWSGGGAWLPIIFYLSVATLFPFAVGPDKALLLRTGGGIIWIAALLASLLPVERLILPDRESGVLDQLALRGLPDESIAMAKILAHWLGFAPPLLAATMLASLLMGLEGARLGLLLLGLLLATPALAALAVMAAALTAGLRGAGALAGLIILPLAVPVLIFGAGSLSGDADGAAGALKLLAAVSLALTAMAPFAAGAALRAGRE